MKRVILSNCQTVSSSRSIKFKPAKGNTFSSVFLAVKRQVFDAQTTTNTKPGKYQYSPKGNIITTQLNRNSPERDEDATVQSCSLAFGSSRGSSNTKIVRGLENNFSSFSKKQNSGKKRAFDQKKQSHDKNFNHSFRDPDKYSEEETWPEQGSTSTAIPESNGNNSTELEIETSPTITCSNLGNAVNKITTQQLVKELPNLDSINLLMQLKNEIPIKKNCQTQNKQTNILKYLSIREMIQRLAEDIHFNPKSRTLSIEINPKGLGKIKLEVSLEDSILNLTIFVEDTEIMNILKAEKNLIKSMLYKNGFIPRELNFFIYPEDNTPPKQSRNKQNTTLKKNVKEETTV